MLGAVVAGGQDDAYHVAGNGVVVPVVPYLAEKLLEPTLAPAVHEELDKIRRIRNALCHRMVAAHADPHGDGLAYVTCRLADGATAHHSASELEQAIRELEGMVRRAPPS